MTFYPSFFKAADSLYYHFYLSNKPFLKLPLPVVWGINVRALENFNNKFLTFFYQTVISSS